MKKVHKRRPTMSEVLLREILDSGKSLYRVSKDSGVPYATLHRFVCGKRAVSMAALDKLCLYLGLKLTS
jgi:plasmid maintenance system antidote protein VapI